MEPIHVPGPPKQAFNKNRRVSDLIRAQTNHLKHLESKMPAALRNQIPQHAITTEEDAAIYIAAMTRLLRAQATAPIAAAVIPTPISIVKESIPIRPTQGLAIAASGEDPTVPHTEAPGSKANGACSEALK